MDRAALGVSFTPPAAFTTRPTLTGTFGMTASTHWIATATAQAVLERGGNAFDAVVAGGFVLHVVEPHLNGPGGDLVGVFQRADAASPTILMGQGPAPAGASIAHYRARGLDSVPGSGGLAATVPGAVDAWLVLLRDHGTWSVADVLAFAIGYARDGHALLPQASATITRVAELFRDHWPSSAEQWLDDGSPPAPGTMIVNEPYAAFLDDLVGAETEAGTAGAARADRIDAVRLRFRTRVGAEAAAFLSTPHRHSDGRDHPAVLTADDLAAFEAGYEEPLTVSFRGHLVAKAGAWSQGPVLLEALGILDPLDDDALDPSTALGAHTLLGALTLALADRDAHLGDGSDAAALLDPDYLATRRARLGDRASTAWEPGEPSGVPGWRPPLRTAESDVSGGRSAAGTGEPTVARTGQTRGDTCQIDVVDRWGNIVAVTPSGGWLQSSPTLPGLGFCLGTRLQMMWLDEDSPAALRPGARPRTTLTPTLVQTPDGSRWALGSPGGDQQDQWQLPMLVRMIVGGYTGQQAVDAPTFHTTALVDSFWPRAYAAAGAVVEDRLGDDVIAGLIARGHEVTRAGDWALGRLAAVGRAADGRVWAAANPRGMQGYAAGR